MSLDDISKNEKYNLIKGFQFKGPYEDVGATCSCRYVYAHLSKKL